MPNLDHSLFNPNQLRHFGTVIQDKPYDAEPMSIKSADNTFTACLDLAGTDIFLKMWAPSDTDLRMYPHVVLSSNAQWTPKLVRFPGTPHLDQEKIESRNVCGVQTMEACLRDRRVSHEMKEDLIFSISELRTRIILSARVTYDDLEARAISQLRFKELHRQFYQARLKKGTSKCRTRFCPRTVIQTRRQEISVSDGVSVSPRLRLLSRLRRGICCDLP